MTKTKTKTKTTAKPTAKAKPTDTIYQFIHGRRKQVVGVLLAHAKENGIVTIGWSLAATTRGDKFDKEVGLKIAKERTMARHELTIPHTVRKHLPRFEHRCRRFFRDKIIINHTPISEFKLPDFININSKEIIKKISNNENVEVYETSKNLKKEYILINKKR